VRDGENQDGNPINHRFLCVLQRWQIYPNIALSSGVIVGFHKAGILLQSRSGTVNGTMFFTSGFAKKDVVINQ
jgi:hypothetical protein